MNKKDEGSPPPSRQPQHAPFAFPFHDPRATIAGSGFVQQEQQQNTPQHGHSSFAASSGPVAAAAQQQHGGTENPVALFSWESSRPAGHGHVPGQAPRGQEGGHDMKLAELHKLQRIMKQNLEHRQHQLMMQLQATHAHYVQQQQPQPQPPQPTASGGHIHAHGSNDDPGGSVAMQIPRMPGDLLNMYLGSYSSASERSLLGGQMGTPLHLLPTAPEQQEHQQHQHQQNQQQEPSVQGLQHGYLSNQSLQQQAILQNNTHATARQIDSSGAASTLGQEAASHQANTRMSQKKGQENEFSANDALPTVGRQQQDVLRRRSDPFLQWQFTANHSDRSAATDNSSRLQQQEQASYSQTMAAPQQQSQLHQQNIDMGIEMDMDIQEGMDVPLNFSNLFDNDDEFDDNDDNDDSDGKEKPDYSVIHGGFHPMLMNQSSIIPNYAQQQQQQQQQHLNPNQSVGTIGTLPQPAGIWQQHQQQRQDTSFGLHETSSSSVVAFSRSPHSSTNLHQRILKLDKAMEKSIKSQKMLQAWDTKMGLRKCHSKTMRSTTTSRKKVQEMMVSTIMRTGGATAFLFPKQA